MASTLKVRTTELITVGTPANRLLRFGLGTAVACLLVLTLVGLAMSGPVGLDLRIILDASARWLAGEDPYVAVTGPETNGAPFLQPPFFLPLFAPLTLLPLQIVIPIWIAIEVVAAVLALRRLAIPVVLIPLVLAWGPFSEGLYYGNVQVLSFAAFVFAFWTKPQRADTHPEPRPTEPPAAAREVDRVGVLAAVVAALKVTQIHPWVSVLGRRPMAALVGAAVLAIPITASIALTGPVLWVQWLEQIGRAAQMPGIGWSYSLVAPMGPLLELSLIGLSVIGALLVRGPTAGLAVGILVVIAAPSLRIHGLEFLVPAMLFIRREVALVGAILIGLYLGLPVWSGILLISATAAAAIHWPRLREPSEPSGG